MKNIIVITGASSGFGALAARALALAGHTVYASMRETTGRNAAQVEAAKQFATENGVDLRTIELDVASQGSADQAIKTIVEKDGRLDVVIHNAGHMVFGAAEAFTPEQLLQVYDTERAQLAARQPCRSATTAQTEKGTGPLGGKYQYARRHSTLSFALLCGEGRYGCACCQLCR